ncbi:MAG: hypothetical protein QM804_16630 [Propionicimonas sp.]
MTDLERAFRDALRRADSVEVPVPPIDPVEVKGAGRGRRPWRSGLAAAAALLLIAGVGIAVWASGRGVPAMPSAPGAPSEQPPEESGPPSVAPEPGYTAATVEVELYSGRENPVIDLDGSVAEELYALVTDRRERLAQQSLDWSLPEEGLGFRGFRVTYAPDAGRPALLILPGLVQVGSDDDREIYADPDGTLFQLVASVLTDGLRDEVAAGTVQVRMQNFGDTRLDDVRAAFPSNERLELGSLLAGASSEYHIVQLAYEPTWIAVKQRGKEWVYQPVDYVGETRLRPGRYTYEIRVVDEGNGERLGLRLSHDSDGGWPGKSASAPDGAAGTWRLVNAEQVGPDSTQLAIAVTRVECNGGVTGEVLRPVVAYSRSEVVIRALVARIEGDGPRSCPENDWVETTVKLAEPIGDRELVDAACLAGEAVETSVCAEGPVRWTP